MKDTFEKFQQPERGRFGDNEVERLPARGGNKLHDFDCDVIERRDRAVKVKLHSNGRYFWFPLSHCEVTAKEGGKGHTITIAEWILISKGIL